MQPPAVPPNETERLEDLYAYGLLDQPDEKVFEELVGLAAAICGTRFAAMTLVDRHRQYFSARYGLPFEETSREESVCGHAILADELFEVEDTDSDVRFQGNPLLSGSPRIRFYAGSQLRSPRGNAVGMLCVLDSEPGELSQSQRDAMVRLSGVIVSVMDTRREIASMRVAANALANLADPAMVLAAGSLTVLYVNPSAARHFGVAPGLPGALHFSDLASAPGREDLMEASRRLEAGGTSVEMLVTALRGGAPARPASWRKSSMDGRAVILCVVDTLSTGRPLDAEAA